MGSAVGCHSVHSQATENGEVCSESDSSQGKGVGAEEEDNAEAGKSGIETSSNEQEASEGEDEQEHHHTQDTLTSVSQLFGEHEDTDPERKSRQHSKSSARTAPRRTTPRKTPADHRFQRKSHQPMRHSEMELGKKRGCLTYASMLGIVTKLPTMSWSGQHKIP